MPGKQWEGMTIKETLEEFQVDSERAYEMRLGGVWN